MYSRFGSSDCSQHLLARCMSSSPLRRRGATSSFPAVAEFPLDFLVIEGAENHLAHEVDAVPFKKHVFGATEPNAFSAELARDRASAGVSAFVRTLIVRALSAHSLAS